MSEIWTVDMLQRHLNESPFIQFSQIKALEIDLEAKEITLKMPSRGEFLRSPDSTMWHGGPIAALIDTAGDFAIAVQVGGGVPTINFRTDYLRPCFGEYLIAKAKIQAAGRSIGVADVHVFDQDDRLCAIGRGTYSTRVG